MWSAWFPIFGNRCGRWSGGGGVLGGYVAGIGSWGLVYVGGRGIGGRSRSGMCVILSDDAGKLSEWAEKLTESLMNLAEFIVMLSESQAILAEVEVILTELKDIQTEDIVILTE